VTDSKIEIKVGSITFSGEGSGDWLSKQLDKVLAKIPELLSVAPPEAAGACGKTGANAPGASGTQSGQGHGTLVAYLKSTGSTSKQVRKFLATAAWLHDTQQKLKLATGDVTTALSQHNQGRLSNPSDALNQNVGKGLCVKEGNAFYVTPEGRTSLGQ
jgi:hypothetical protein